MKPERLGALLRALGIALLAVALLGQAALSVLAQDDGNGDVGTPTGDAATPEAEATAVPTATTTGNPAADTAGNGSDNGTVGSGMGAAQHPDGGTFGAAALINGVPGDNYHTNSDGSITLISNAGTSNVNDQDGYINFPLPEGGAKLSDFSVIRAVYQPEPDDDCTGGSPRFSVGVQTPENGVQYFFIALQNPPNSSCPGVTDLGNLVGSSLPVFFMTSGVGGNDQYTDWNGAVAVIGDQPIVGIFLIVDGGNAFQDQEQGSSSTRLRRRSTPRSRTA